jgi:hypothetical protein
MDEAGDNINNQRCEKCHKEDYDETISPMESSDQDELEECD